MPGTRASSVETAQRRLLSPSRPESVRSVQTLASQTSSASTLVPEAAAARRTVSFPENPITSASHRDAPYKGFASKEAYTASLVQFLHEKQYFESDHQMIGFYGTKTVADYLSQPGGPRAQTKEERRAVKAQKARSKLEELQARKMSMVPEEIEDVGLTKHHASETNAPRARRASKFSGFFSRSG